jgi:hypothetical protein
MHSTQTAISISLHEHNAEQFRKLYESLTRSRSIILPSQRLTADSVNEYPHHPRPNDFQLSWQASEKVYYALNHAWADSTIRKYSNSVKQFHNFCDCEGVPHEYHLPAAEFLLCSFAASDVGILSGHTVQNCISAVRVWHVACNAPWLGDL